MGDDNLNQNELAVFAYACQLLLKNHLYFLMQLYMKLNHLINHPHALLHFTSVPLIT